MRVRSFLDAASRMIIVVLFVIIAAMFTSSAYGLQTWNVSDAADLQQAMFWAPTAGDDVEILLDPAGDYHCTFPHRFEIWDSVNHTVVIRGDNGMPVISGKYLFLVGDCLNVTFESISFNRTDNINDPDISEESGLINILDSVTCTVRNCVFYTGVSPTEPARYVIVRGFDHLIEYNAFYDMVDTPSGDMLQLDIPWFAAAKTGQLTRRHNNAT